MKIFLTRVRLFVHWILFALITRAPLFVVVAYLKTPRASRNYATGRIERARYVAECARKDFSADWFTTKITRWVEVLNRPDLQRTLSGPLRGLEIGSWEGMSSIFLLQRFPSLHLTCVDTWLGGDEHNGSQETLQAERRFQANTHEFRDRMRVWKGNSLSYFAENSATKSEDAFDLIYVDGSHYADDVLTDALLCFERLRVGGIIIFDDYQWRAYSELRSNPAAALNAFLRLKSRYVEILSASHQIIARKIGVPSHAVQLQFSEGESP